MARHVVCLTFDFDAMTGFIARGMTTPTPISRGEFGLVGLVRILQLLRTHAIRATFFVPGVVIDMFPDACERIVAAGHEIGHHGYTHVPPANLSREQEAEGLVKGNAAIARIAGKPARGYRSPSWDLSAHTVELLLEQGFAYESIGGRRRRPRPRRPASGSGGGSTAFVPVFVQRRAVAAQARRPLPLVLAAGAPSAREERVEVGAAPVERRLGRVARPSSDHRLDGVGRQLHSGQRIRSNPSSSSGPSDGMIVRSRSGSVFFSSSMVSSLCDARGAMREARARRKRGTMRQEKGGGS